MKALVLLSGGTDSSTCLSVAVNKFGNKNVSAVSIFYKQKHERELQSAKAVADFYGVKFYQLNLSQIFSKSSCSLIVGSKREIEHKNYSEQMNDNGVISSYVPFRNGLMLSMAASFAYSIFDGEQTEIYIGAHADDFAYADCSKEFINAMNAAILFGTYGKIKIVAPFVGKTKVDVVKVGLELGTPYKLTWSCYEGGETPCGECGTCIDRKKAFELNGVKDPSED